MSKSQLRRIEVVAPEAIKELREQIAKRFENATIREGLMMSEYGDSCISIKDAVALVRNTEF